MCWNSLDVAEKGSFHAWFAFQKGAFPKNLIAVCASATEETFSLTDSAYYPRVIQQIEDGGHISSYSLTVNFLV